MDESSRSRIARDPVEASDRDDARRRLRAIRERLAREPRSQADARIRAALESQVVGAAPRVLAGYWPINGEPDIRESLERWHAAGIVVSLPRVIASGRALEFSRWTPGVAMVGGAFGTLNPQPHEALVPELLIIPCLGFDVRCHRLGYGGGYYDRTLEALAAQRGVPGDRAGSAARAEPRTIGVAYDECEITGFVAQAHDRALDAVVTQRRALLRPAAH